MTLVFQVQFQPAARQMPTVLEMYGQTPKTGERTFTTVSEINGLPIEVKWKVR